jgi:hypothetical protein
MVTYYIVFTTTGYAKLVTFAELESLLDKLTYMRYEIVDISLVIEQ